jgi:hypothetical protein
LENTAVGLAEQLGVFVVGADAVVVFNPLEVGLRLGDRLAAQINCTRHESVGPVAHRLLARPVRLVCKQNFIFSYTVLAVGDDCLFCSFAFLGRSQCSHARKVTARREKNVFSVAHFFQLFTLLRVRAEKILSCLDADLFTPEERKRAGFLVLFKI